MNALRRFGAPLAAIIVAPAARAEVIVTGNPHSLNEQSPVEIASDVRGGAPLSKGGRSIVSGENLVPENIVLSPVWPLQTETVRDVVPVKMRNPHGFPATFRAPVYHFVQSPRLTEQQLPFKLLLLKNLVNSPNVVSVPVDLKSASDSWFPTLKWDLLLGVNAETKEVQHLGWRFSPIGKKRRQTSDDGFYALIVEHLDEEEAVAEAAAKIGIEDMIKLPQHPSLKDLEIAPRRADAWMLSALATAIKLGTKVGV